MLKRIIHKNILIAVIIKAGYKKEGIEFFTPSDFSQQLAYMHHPKGFKISPHVHKKVNRQVFFTQEALFIKSGKIRVDFYTPEKEYIQSEVLKTGDTLFLASGGHGFTFLEQGEMIEIKQGPYAGEEDKEKFTPPDIKTHEERQ